VKEFLGSHQDAKVFPGSADTLAGRALVDQVVAFAVLTFSLVVPVGAARAVLGVIVAGLGRRQSDLDQ
jgi:hypothetical protein